MLARLGEGLTTEIVRRAREDVEAALGREVDLDRTLDEELVEGLAFWRMVQLGNRIEDEVAESP